MMFISRIVNLVYQGSLSAGATPFSGLLSPGAAQRDDRAGGLLIIGVGLKLLRMRDVATADFLPAIAVAPVMIAVAARFKEVLGL